MKDRWIVPKIIVLWIIISFIVLPETVIVFIHTILGKVAVVALIVYFTVEDPLIGLLACLTAIAFYNHSVVEGMLNGVSKNDEGYKSLKSSTAAPAAPADDELDVFDYMSDPSDFALVSPLGSDQFEYAEGVVVDGFTSINTKTFRQAHCERGRGFTASRLTHKGFDVKPEMTEHVFPEVHFTDEPCNACDTNCGFVIIDKKLHTEDALIKPKSSNDNWHADLWRWFLPLQEPKGVARVQTEPFTKFG